MDQTLVQEDCESVMKIFLKDVLLKVLLGWPGFVILLILLFIIFKPDIGCAGCDHDLPNHRSVPVSIFDHFDWPDPSGWLHQFDKPDTVAVAHHDKPVKPEIVTPVVSVTETHGSSSIEILTDSVTTTILQYDPPVYGGAQFYIDPETFQYKIAYDAIVWEPELIVGLDYHGLNAGLHTLYFRRVLFLHHVHAPTIVGSYEMWDTEDRNLYVGIGADISIFPEHTPLKFGAAYTWNIDDLSQSRATIFLDVGLLR